MARGITGACRTFLSFPTHWMSATGLSMVYCTGRGWRRVNFSKGCARCAAVLTSNRKCARCKVANYCSRDCQARHWDTHKATCRKADAPPRPPAPPGGAPIVQAVGRAANLEGAGAAAMNDLETQMQGLAQILREGGAGAADMRRAVADVPQAG